MKEKLPPLALAFDNNYLDQFYVLATSLFYHNKQSLQLHVIATGLTEEQRMEIENFVLENNGTIYFYIIPSDFGEDLKVKGHWTKATYYRLLFPVFLPKDIKKFIYLDTDMLIVGDLKPIALVDITHKVLAAVVDPLIGARPELDILEDENYFNAGFLYINKENWEKEQVTQKVLEYLRANHDLAYLDQDGLNYILKEKWIKIPSGYNVMHAFLPQGLSRKEYKGFIEDKFVLHFTLDRPWKMLTRHPYFYLYKFFHGKSPARERNIFVDFTFANWREYLKIKIINIYFELRLVKYFWRKIKSYS